MEKQHTNGGEATSFDEVAEFGETVLYLKMGTKGRDKLDSRWETGIWMGVKDETGECIIGTSEGTVKARDFKRIADNSARWSAELVKSVKGTPWQPTPGRNDDMIPVRVRLAEEGTELTPNPDSIAAPKPEIKRRARIARSEVIGVGFTIGCPGCTAISRGEKEAQNHTEECRTRLEKTLIEE